MSWELLWSSRASRDLRRRDPQIADRVVSAAARFAADEIGDVRKLSGPGRDEWRLRVGDFRVRFEKDTELRTLTVIRVLHHSQAYRD